jgi:hypothetical protein
MKTVEYKDSQTGELMETVHYAEDVNLAAAIDSKVKALEGVLERERDVRGIRRVEIRIPLELRRKITPRPGDRVRIKMNGSIGTFRYSSVFGHNVLLDDGSEWEIESIHYIEIMPND